MEEDVERIKRNFGIKLRIIMIKKGKRPMDLSRELKIPQSTISDWCSGRVYPRLEKMLLLAKYFNMEYNDLVKTNDNFLDS